MTLRRLFPALAALLALSGCCRSGADRSLTESDLKALAKAQPFEMQAPALPRIPSRTVLLTDFGAVGDGRGLCTDAFDDEVAATAGQLLLDADASYLNLRGTEEIEEDISLMAWPTTYFVDSEGRLLTAPFEGASPDTYRAMLADCLAQLG